MTALLDHPWGLLLTAAAVGLTIGFLTITRTAARPTPPMPAPHPAWTPQALDRLWDDIWLFDAPEFTDTPIYDQLHLDMWDRELDAS